MTSEEIHTDAGTAREGSHAFRCCVLVCHSSPCRAAGAEEVYEALMEAVKTLNLDVEVEVTTSGCSARCTDGPLVTIRIPGKKDVIYTNVTAECIMGIVKGLVPGLTVSG